MDPSIDHNQRRDARRLDFGRGSTGTNHPSTCADCEPTSPRLAILRGISALVVGVDVDSSQLRQQQRRRRRQQRHHHEPQGHGLSDQLDGGHGAPYHGQSLDAVRGYLFGVLGVRPSMDDEQRRNTNAVPPKSANEKKDVTVWTNVVCCKNGLTPVIMVPLLVDLDDLGFIISFSRRTTRVKNESTHPVTLPSGVAALGWSHGRCPRPDDEWPLHGLVVQLRKSTTNNLIYNKVDETRRTFYISLCKKTLVTPWNDW